MTRSVEELIVATLKGVSALGGRVYPSVAEKGVAKPYAVWTIVSRTEDADFDGHIELEDVYLQVDVYSASSKECVAVAKSCRAALRGINGANCKTETFGRQGYEGDTKLHRDSSDYRILVESED